MDYISSSQAIQKFLDKEKITFEVDEFAPAIFRMAHVHDLCGKTPQVRIEVRGDDTPSSCYTCVACDTLAQFVRPFYGPGGSDNSLKALRGWCKKNNGDIRTQPVIEFGKTDWIEWHLSVAPCHMLCRVQTPPEDGIALHDLLYKLAKEEK